MDAKQAVGRKERVHYESIKDHMRNFEEVRNMKIENLKQDRMDSVRQ